MKLVIATTSAHKIREIRALLGAVPALQVLALSDFGPIEEPDEDGASMAENAHLKAEYYARHTGLPTLADDSGLEVDALGGAPGVHSARWAPGSDQDRARALLERVRDVPDEQRGARYRCALCLAQLERSGSGACIELEAACEGRIGREERGSNGFGYDPIFELTAATGAPELSGQTMAQIAPEAKARLSHRARAVRELAQRLRAQQREAGASST